MSTVTALVLLLLSLMLPALALAQSGDKNARSEAEEALKKMDANGDGSIDPREVPYRAKRFIERAASDAGLDPTKPIPVDKLREALGKLGNNRHDDKPSSSASEPATPPAAATPGTTPDPKATPAPAAVKSDATSTSPKNSVPGFGEADKLPKAPGFDVPPTVAAASSQSGFTSRGDSDRGERRSERGDNSKVKRYAESLLKQYDANKNGVLEKDEWSKMSGSPEKADTDKDGMLSLDELTARLAQFSNNDGDHSDSSSGSGGSSGTTSSGSRSDASKSTDGKPAVRFLTPTERLPKGLPEWFARNDANGDGQVAMAEFTTSWTNDKAAEFARHDRDQDGYITPAECLAALAAEKKTTR